MVLDPKGCPRGQWSEEQDILPRVKTLALTFLLVIAAIAFLLSLGGTRSVGCSRLSCSRRYRNWSWRLEDEEYERQETRYAESSTLFPILALPTVSCGLALRSFLASPPRAEAPQSRSLAYASRNPFGGVTRRRPLSVDGSDHRTRGPSWRYRNSSSIRASGP